MSVPVNFPAFFVVTGTFASETTGIVPSLGCRLLWNTTAPVKKPGLVGAGTLTVNEADLPGRTTLEAGVTAWLDGPEGLRGLLEAHRSLVVGGVPSEDEQRPGPRSGLVDLRVGEPGPEALRVAVLRVAALRVDQDLADRRLAGSAGGAILQRLPADPRVERVDAFRHLERLAVQLRDRLAGEVLGGLDPGAGALRSVARLEQVQLAAGEIARLAERAQHRPDLRLAAGGVLDHDRCDGASL